jgi:hypothetical protein
MDKPKTVDSKNRIRFNSVRRTAKHRSDSPSKTPHLTRPRKAGPAPVAKGGRPATRARSTRPEEPMKTAFASPPLYTLHPKICLSVCHLCLGRGYVLAMRKGQVVRENCVNCAARGSIVGEAA